jgi:phage terminase small subunit
MAQHLEPTVPDPGPQSGAAMAQCTPMQRRFVMAMLTCGDLNHGACAKLAGSKGSSYESLAVLAHQMLANPKVKAAIQEQAELRLASAKIMAVSQLVQMAAAPSNDATKLKAVLAILNRTGMHEVSESHVVHTDMNQALEDDLATLEHWAKMTGTTLAPEYQRLLDARKKIAPVLENDPSESIIEHEAIDPDADILGE